MARCVGNCACCCAALFVAWALLLGMRPSAPRALHATAVEAGNCEDFFLLDGRSPVELPDTWGEARTAFEEMCGLEGYSSDLCTRLGELLGGSYWKDSDTPLDVSPELCEALLSLATASLSGEVVPEHARAEDAALLARAAVQGHCLDGAKSVDATATAKVTKGGVHPGSSALAAERAAQPPAHPLVWLAPLLIFLFCFALLGWPLLPSSPPCPSAEGAEGALRLGDRVQTQWTREEGGDGRWYQGRVTRVNSPHNVTVTYDDGDVWTGSSCFVYPPPGARAASPVHRGRRG